jgi:hypothetical protein
MAYIALDSPCSYLFGCKITASLLRVAQEESGPTPTTVSAPTLEHRVIARPKWSLNPVHVRVHAISLDHPSHIVLHHTYPLPTKANRVPCSVGADTVVWHERAQAPGSDSISAWRSPYVQERTSFKPSVSNQIYTVVCKIIQTGDL